MLSVGVVGLSAGCDSDRGDQLAARGFELRDSAGVAIAYSQAPAWSEADRWRIAAEPALRIVTPDDPSPPYVLHEVGDIERLSDGRVVVENDGTEELLVFDEGGSFIEAWGGGKGDGPNEFLNMQGMFGCGDDHIAVTEYHRVTEFSSDGRQVRRDDLPLDSVTRDSPTISSIGVSPDCSSVLMTALVSDWLPSASTVGFASLISEVSWTHGPNAPVDVLGAFPFIEYYKIDAHARSGIEWSTFTYEASLATHGGWVYFGLGDRAEVEVLGRAGETIRIIRWDTADSVITEADWDEYSRDRAAYIADNPSRASSRPSRRDHVPRTRKPLFAAERLPALVRQNYAFRIDDQGRLWVRRYRRPSLSGRPEFQHPERWWVFGADGRWLGEVVAPESFRLESVRAGHVFGVTMNALDVEEVLAYRIIIPSERRE